MALRAIVIRELATTVEHHAPHRVAVHSANPGEQRDPLDDGLGEEQPIKGIAVPPFRERELSLPLGVGALDVEELGVSSGDLAGVEVAGAAGRGSLPIGYLIPVSHSVATLTTGELSGFKKSA